MPPDMRTAIRATAQRTGTDSDVSTLKQERVFPYVFPRPSRQGACCARRARSSVPSLNQREGPPRFPCTA